MNEGGLWRTDGSYQAVLMLKNTLETSAIAATPVLYLADGTEYDLPPVQLDPAGVAMVDLNTALAGAPAALGPHMSSFGSAAVKSAWPWPAVFAAIRNSDDIRGMLYQSHMEANANLVNRPLTPPTQQLIESTWWKQDRNVNGFLTLTNASLNPVTASVTVGDNAGSATARREYALAPHATVWIDFAPYWAQLPAASDAGLLEISYAGAMNAVIADGGMEDADKGYSHMLHFQVPQPLLLREQLARLPLNLPANFPRPDLRYSQNSTFDSTGIMVGTQAADMHFPAGTSFTPYLVLRNTTTQPLPVRLAANAELDTGPRDLPLGALVLAPYETRQLDMGAILRASPLNGLNGYVNLRTTFAGSPTDLLQESGSVDRSLNYVFEVPPRLERASGPGMLNYWSANGDTDTMITLYNYGEAPQDVLFTLEHQEGSYEMPVHLAPHASMSFSVAQLIRSGVPDRKGNTIPISIVQGGARLAGLTGSHQEQLTVAVAAGIFNSRTGTCSYACFYCDGGEFIDITPDSFDLPWNDASQLDLTVTFAQGDVEDYTSQASFSSENTSIATQSASWTTGAAIGGTLVDGFVTVEAGDEQLNCAGVQGCGTEALGGAANVFVMPRILMGLNGAAPGQDITGITQSVIVGQQVQLKAQYQMPSGDSIDSQSWTIPGTTASGWTHGSPASPVSTSGPLTTVYWTAPDDPNDNNVEFDLQYTDSGGQSQQSLAETNVNAAGPTNVQVSTTLGGWGINGDTLQLLGTRAGIWMAPSASPPRGASNNFYWVQTLTKIGTTALVGSSTISCTSSDVPGLDTHDPYPFYLDSPANTEPQDSPFLDFTANATDQTYSIDANMYLLWHPGLSGDLLVPLGYVGWGGTGHARLVGGSWVPQADSTASAAFAPSSSYPTWGPTYVSGDDPGWSCTGGSPGGSAGRTSRQRVLRVPLRSLSDWRPYRDATFHRTAKSSSWGNANASARPPARRPESPNPEGVR
ncbi:MAG: hypothetical protein ACRD1L_04965 [Terriglobales bacterium]